jgi:large subunit ribosomal protein L22
MEAIAKTKHLKGSPRKARLVIDLIRGRNVSQALAILKFTDKRAADPIEKTLRSAIANATYLAEQQNVAIDPDDLWVKTCFVDMGAHKNRRRMRPAPQGRAYREQRHYCHITIQVTSDEMPKTEKELKAEAAKAKRAAAGAGEKKIKAPAKTAAAVDSAATAEAADVKNTTTQNPEELNETKQADERQLDENEQLERQ